MNIKDIEKEIEYLKFEVGQSGDWSRVANVLEAVANLLTQQREEAVEGFRKWHNEQMIATTYVVEGINFSPKLLISEESVRTYLQSLDGGDGE